MHGFPHEWRTEHDQYVEKINWLIQIGRDDLIDDVADQYERPIVVSVSRSGRPRHLHSVS
jgi:hypothetical protein